MGTVSSTVVAPRLRLFALALVTLVIVFPGAPASQSPTFAPVTDAMLLNPDPADWPHWRRTLDGSGYSPLAQINTKNVHQLQLAWSWSLQPGQSQPAPIVSQGVMYIPIPGGGAQALDAATGDLRWEYKPSTPAGAPQRTTPMRTLAIYGDKVYIAVADARLMALDARTGKLVWEHQVADSKIGYSYSSGPIAAKGLIVAGITGCARYKNDICFISAHDPQTGKEIWRTSTIARPGDPGGDTWGDLPLTFRAGGDAWIPGSYDPKTNLIYWGTSQAKPWARFARGTDGAALYTNSTLAIDPATGRIVWYFQHLPGESHDMDETFERVLVDLDDRPSVFTMGKLAILWELDRTTGAFRHAHDLGYQNLLDVDPPPARSHTAPTSCRQARPTSSRSVRPRQDSRACGRWRITRGRRRSISRSISPASAARLATYSVPKAGADGPRPTIESRSSREPGRTRRVSRDERHERSGAVAASHADASDHRPRSRPRAVSSWSATGIATSTSTTPRREHPVSNAAAHFGAGLSAVICSRRPAISRGARGNGRWRVGHARFRPTSFQTRRPRRPATRSSSLRCRAEQTLLSGRG